jgi:hypothetical protein
MSSTTIDLSAPIEDACRRIAPCFGRSETRAEPAVCSGTPQQDGTQERVAARRTS